MHLTCPHGKAMTPVNVLGIMIYEHEGGKGCNAMNKIDFSPDSVLSAMVKGEEFEDSRQIRAALKASQTARERIMGQMKDADSAELRLLLNVYWNAVKTDYLPEMITWFGRVVVSNLGEALGVEIRTSTTTIAQNGIYKMVDLREEKTLDVIDVIRHMVERNKLTQESFRGIGGKKERRSSDDDFSNQLSRSLLEL